MESLDTSKSEVSIKEMQIRNILSRYKFLNSREVDQITSAILALFKADLRKGEK